VLVGTIRHEIASCSEKAYASLPVSNAKQLLFLESEGAVVDFAGEVRLLLITTAMHYAGHRDVLTNCYSEIGMSVTEESTSHEMMVRRHRSRAPT